MDEGRPAWKDQLELPSKRRYDAASKHGGVSTTGRHGSIMDLAPPAALEVLRSALYDPAAALGDKAPSLWGYRAGRIYRFMWDNVSSWHGYPADEKPPNAVLRKWRRDGTITNAEYGKILGLPNRGS